MSKALNINHVWRIHSKPRPRFPKKYALLVKKSETNKLKNPFSSLLLLVHILKSSFIKYLPRTHTGAPETCVRVWDISPVINSYQSRPLGPKKVMHHRRPAYKHRRVGDDDPSSSVICDVNSSSIPWTSNTTQEKKTKRNEMKSVGRSHNLKAEAERSFEIQVRLKPQPTHVFWSNQSMGSFSHYRARATNPLMISNLILIWTLRRIPTKLNQTVI